MSPEISKKLQEILSSFITPESKCESFLSENGELLWFDVLEKVSEVVPYEKCPNALDLLNSGDWDTVIKVLKEDGEDLNFIIKKLAKNIIDEGLAMEE